MQKLILIAMICFMAISCENEQPESPQTYNTNISTGIYYYEGNGQLANVYGTPNDKIIKQSSAQTDFIAYPNPCNNDINILSTNEVQSLWVIRAKTSSNYEAYSIDNITPNQITLESLEIFKNKNINEMQFAIRTSSLANGFYRIYILDKNDDFYWQTIFVDHNDNADNTIAQVW